jgi:hypothetical protein
VQTIASVPMNFLTHNPEEELSEKAKAFLARPKKLYINGEFVDAVDGETFRLAFGQRAYGARPE